MKKMLRGFAVLAVALAFVQAHAGRAEAAGLGRFSKLLHSHAVATSAVHPNALTPRQEFIFKARIVFQQYRSLVFAARIERIQHLRLLFAELRQGLISRQQLFVDRRSVNQTFVSSALILRARLSSTIVALRNDPFGTPATLVR